MTKEKMIFKINSRLELDKAMIAFYDEQLEHAEAMEDWHDRTFWGSKKNAVLDEMEFLKSLLK